MTDWTLCFICQKSTKDPLRSSEDGLVTLAKNIPKFNEIGHLKFDYDRIAQNDEILLTILTTNNAHYHNGCQSSYSDSKLKRLKDSIAKKQEKLIQKNNDEIPKKRSRRSDENEFDEGTSQSNMFQCCWCTKYDSENNLHAAGQLGAKRRPNPAHVDNITRKWKRIASLINHDNVLQKLSQGDVSSNELFYHLPCLTKHTNQYISILHEKEIDTNNESWIKELNINKIVLYLKDVELTNPGTVFIASDLEKMYITMLNGHNIDCTSHTSRFADLIVSKTPGLMRGTSGNKISLFFNTAVLDHSNNPDDFFESISCIVGQVRKAMHLKTQTGRPIEIGNFDKEAQIDSVPIELLTIVNFILEGVNITQKGFSKESLAIAQAMQFNFRLNRDGKKVLSRKRHDVSKETPFPLYVAVKVYSQSRSKTIIDWLYFCAGISISYDRLLSFTKKLSSNLLCQYKRDGVFIPRNLKKGIFTIIAKDNLDVNARSTTATKHYHGTSFSVFQFPSNETPGESIVYQELNELDRLPEQQSTKKVEQLPSSYTEVRQFLTSSPSLMFKPAPKPVLNDLDQCVYANALNEEYEWLGTRNANGLYLNWSKYHAEKLRSAVRKLDISAILPPLDAPVHTLDMQFHCMEYIMKTKNVLNPQQVAVDVCDQPIFALTREIMIRFHETFGQEKYFCLFGSLHIEKTLLIICGELVKGSGLGEIMATCGLSIVSGDSLVTVSHIKRARYCLQVAVCAIFSKLKKHMETVKT